VGEGKGQAAEIGRHRSAAGRDIRHCETNDVARQAFGYFSANRERMRYQAFRDDQLCVSSSMVEGGC